MTRIFTETHLNKPIADVFDYVTTAGNWPAWHPSSLGVSGATNHSALIGEQITERFLVAGRRGEAVWMVRERQSPTRWIIEGQTSSGGGGTITYTLTPTKGGTHFAREFVYFFHNPLFRLLDGLLVRPRIQAESAEALRRLKQVLEAGATDVH
jgi:uncharacterized protein YndB with AHSA1/START domain